MNEETEKAAALAHAPQPVETWFIERGDGYIFACDEAEAWGLFNNRSNWMRRDFKIIGVSDGKTYFDHIKRNRNRASELAQTVAELKQTLQKYLATEDRFRFELLLDESDERVKKAADLRQKVQDEIMAKEQELANINTIVIKEAFNLELNKARGNIRMPSNHDVITPNATDRSKVLNALGK
jgi:hypothetical protein